MATKTLYVGNIPYSASENDILGHFGAYKPSNARIIEGRGFAFVDIDADQLDAAIDEMNNSEMGSRRLTVNEARPRTAGGSSGGSRSYSGGGGGSTGGSDYGGNDREYRSGERSGRGGRDRGSRGGKY